MNRPTAFEKMRKQRANLAMWECRRLQREIEAKQEQWRKEDLAYKLAEIDREGRERMDKITFDLGMAMWGSDLTTCLFHPQPLKVPMPPVYGGERYKPMEIPRPGDAK